MSPPPAESRLIQARRVWSLHGPNAALAHLDVLPAPPPEDSGFVAWATFRAHLLVEVGRAADARALATSLLPFTGADDPAHGRALTALGRALLAESAATEARTTLERALQVGQRAEDAEGVARTWLALAQLHQLEGHAEAALGAVRAAVQQAQGTDALVDALGDAAALELLAGHATVAADHLRAVLALAPADARRPRAKALLLRSTLATRAGDATAAQADLTLARHLVENPTQLGLPDPLQTDLDAPPPSPDAIVVSDDAPPPTSVVDLGEQLLDAGRWQEAAMVLDDAVTDPGTDPGHASDAWMLRAAAAAGLADADVWTQVLARAHREGPHWGSVSQAKALRLAAAAWTQTGTPEHLARAVRAHGLALAQWERLEHATEANRERNALAALRNAPFPAGPFDLFEPIGEGAVGEVWLGRHYLRGTEVAVKVLKAGVPNRLAIQAEARAVGGLEHPGIVRLLATGDLTETSAIVRNQPELTGRPWFAMELVTGGTLQDVLGRLGFGNAQAVLLALLDALAHAHARGVLHLDLKPTNVLLDLTRADGIALAPVPRLADFGLAGLWATLDGSRNVVMGTPRYMAPEQFRGDVAQFGAWTDLYQLGCLAYTLVAGTPPYRGQTVEELEQAHLTEGFPSLPTADRPAGFEPWLRRLVHKDPTQRYAHAADAAHALRQIVDRTRPDPSLDHPVGVAASAPSPTDLPDLTDADLTTVFTLRNWEASPEHGPAPMVPSGELAPRQSPPPIAPGWRTPAMPPAAGAVALDVFALRRVPFVGREQARQRLWDALRSVHREGQPRAVLLEGPSGSGRSALASWLAETAHERGVASLIRLPRDGETVPVLPHVLRQALQMPLSGQGVLVAHVRSRLPADVSMADQQAVIRLVTDQAEPGDGVGPCARTLTALAADRPILLDVKAADLDEEGLVLVGELLRQGRSLTLIEIDEGATDHGSRRARALAENAATTILSLDRPSPAEVEAVVEELLPLEPVVLRKIVDKARGDLHEAVAITTALVEREALTEQADGHLELRTGASVQFPEAMLQPLRPRVDALKDARRDVLAVCALWRHPFTESQFNDACDMVGVTWRSRTLRRLLADELLVRVEDDRYALAHPGLSDLVLDAVAAACRLTFTATLASARFPSRDDGVRGELLALAGPPEAARGPLLQGARDAVAQGDLLTALALLQRRRTLTPDRSDDTDAVASEELALQAALQRAWPPEIDRALSALNALTAGRSEPASVLTRLQWQLRVARFRGDDDEALIRARAILALGPTAPGPARAEAARTLGELALLQGDLTAADQALAEAQSHADADVAYTEALRAEVAHARGDDHARRRLAVTIDNELADGLCPRVLIVGARMATWAGEEAVAERWLVEASVRAPAHDRLTRMQVEATMGYLHLARGDWQALELEAERLLLAPQLGEELRSAARWLLLPCRITQAEPVWTRYIQALNAQPPRQTLQTRWLAHAALRRAARLARAWHRRRSVESLAQLPDGHRAARSP